MGARVTTIRPRNGARTAAPVAPVVLLHGFASSPRVMAPLASHLETRLGRPAWRWAISPGREDLRISALRVHRRLGRGLSAVGGRVDVVAHSMGGLVAAYCLKRFDRGRRIGRVITLGTPFHGTPLARAGSWLLGDRHPALTQMSPGSDLLGELRELDVPFGSELVSVAGGRDHLVRAERTRVEPADRHSDLELPADNHWSLLFTSDALDAVESLLSARREPASCPARRRAA